MVSTATVSRVINGIGSVSPEMRERVLETVREFGYVPNAMARGVRTNPLPLVGIIVPDIINEFSPVSCCTDWLALGALQAQVLDLPGEPRVQGDDERPADLRRKPGFISRLSRAESDGPKMAACALKREVVPAVSGSWQNNK